MTARDVQEYRKALKALDLATKRLTIQLGVKGCKNSAKRLNELFLDLEIEFETHVDDFNTALGGKPSSIDRPHTPSDSTSSSSGEDVPSIRPITATVRTVKSATRAWPDEEETPAPAPVPTKRGRGGMQFRGRGRQNRAGPWLE